jgi:hypothetical protein
LQPFQITEVDAMKSVLSTGAPSISEKGDKQKVVC